MALTLKDIAAELNLSVTLISQVLNGKAAQFNIKKETEALVIKTANELGYVPNKIARGLRLKKTNNIALLTPDLSNPFFAKITKVIQNELRSLGYSLIILESGDETSREINEIKLLESNGVDGILIIPVGQDYLHLEELSNKNFPLVILYRTFKSIKANTVTINNYSNAFDITSILIKNGHIKIALLQGDSRIYTNKERLRGYKEAFEKNDIEFSDKYIIGSGFDRESGYQGTNELLNLHSRPTAIVTTSDFLTLGALQAISENDLKIPNDIAIVGFDSIQINHSLSIPISTVTHPVEELGEIAVKTLIEDINNKGKNQKVKIALKSKLNINKESFKK